MLTLKPASLHSAQEEAQRVCLRSHICLFYIKILVTVRQVCLTHGGRGGSDSGQARVGACQGLRSSKRGPPRGFGPQPSLTLRPLGLPHREGRRQGVGASPFLPGERVRRARSWGGGPRGGRGAGGAADRKRRGAGPLVRPMSP